MLTRCVRCARRYHSIFVAVSAAQVEQQRRELPEASVRLGTSIATLALVGSGGSSASLVPGAMTALPGGQQSQQTPDKAALASKRTSLFVGSSTSLAAAALAAKKGEPDSASSPRSSSSGAGAAAGSKESKSGGAATEALGLVLTDPSSQGLALLEHFVRAACPPQDLDDVLYDALLQMLLGTVSATTLHTAPVKPSAAALAAAGKGDSKASSELATETVDFDIPTRGGGRNGGGDRERAPSVDLFRREVGNPVRSASCPCRPSFSPRVLFADHAAVSIRRSQGLVVPSARRGSCVPPSCPPGLADSIPVVSVCSA